MAWKGQALGRPRPRLTVRHPSGMLAAVNVTVPPVEPHQRSLSEVHSSVEIPRQLSFWRRFFAFSGPAYLISVGYMDPGNWATDIAGGSGSAIACSGCW